MSLFHPFQPIKEPMARTQGYPPCSLVENWLRVLDAAKVSDETMLTRPCVGRHPPAQLIPLPLNGAATGVGQGDERERARRAGESRECCAVVPTCGAFMH